MSNHAFLEEQENRLRKVGIFSSRPADDIQKIVNMSEWEFYDLSLEDLVNYMGRVTQHIVYLQQETNVAKAREVLIGNEFKKRASWVLSRLTPEEKKGRNSVEERHHLVCEHDKVAEELFKEWERAQLLSILLDDMPDRYVEVLNVLKKAHADKMEERRIV